MSGARKTYPAYKDSGVEWIGEIPEGWEVKRLKYVAAFNPPCVKKINIEQPIGYIPMDCVKNGYLNPEEKMFDELATGLTCFQSGDIVLAKVTPCFENGNIAIASDIAQDVAFGSSELFVFRVTSIDTKFLFYIFQNSEFRNICISTMQGAGGLKRVSAVFIQNTPISFPPLPEQQVIADYLDTQCSAIDSQKAQLVRSMDLLREYRGSLITHAVTGKIDVREVSVCAAKE